MAKTMSLVDRDAVLTRTRTLKMARSTHAYVRGNTAQFYEWLDASAAAKNVPQGPPIWICGDCHLGNLGSVADAEGRVDIQIRDLDQTPSATLLMTSSGWRFRLQRQPGVRTSLG